MSALSTISRIRDWWHTGRAASLRRAVEARAEVYGPIMGQWGSSTYGAPRDVSAQSLVERYIGWQYICANLNGGAVASVPLKLYVITGQGHSKPKVKTRSIGNWERQRLEANCGNPKVARRLKAASKVDEVLQHPFLDLMDQVHEGMDGFQFREFVSVSQDMTGNSYIYLVRNGLGIPKEMYPLLPQYVSIIPDKARGVGGYKYGYGGNEVRFKPEEIVHHKYISLKNPLYGMSPIEADVIVVDLDKSINEFENALLENDAVPDVIFTTEHPMSPEQRKRLLREWENRFKGPGKRGKPTILSGIKKEQISLSPREMNFLQGRKFTRQRICALYQVPEALVTTENVNKANVEGAKYLHALKGVLPRCRRTEQKWNEQLIPRFDPQGRLFCQFDNPVPEDREDRRAERQNRLSLYMTSINEEREEDNYPPVPWGDTPLVPMNVMPLGSAPPVAPAPPKGEKDIQPHVIFDGYKAETKGRFSRVGDDLRITGFTASLKKLFDAQRKDVLGNMKMANGSKASYPESEIDNWLFDEAKWNVEMGDGAKPHLSLMIGDGGKTAMEALRLEIPTEEFWFDVERPEIRQFIAQHPYKFARKVNETTADRLRGTLSEGIGEGENIFYLRKRVEGVYGELEQWRAARIARTETSRAYCAGQEMAWMQSEVVSQKEWLAAGDCCPFCDEMNGKVVALGMAFAQDTVADAEGHTLDVTYEETGVGYPPLHPNCRCDIVPVVKDTMAIPEATTGPKPVEVPDLPAALSLDEKKAIMSAAENVSVEMEKTGLWSKQSNKVYHESLDKLYQSKAIPEEIRKSGRRVHDEMFNFWQRGSDSPHAEAMKLLTDRKTVYHSGIGYGDDKKSILSKIKAKQNSDLKQALSMMNTDKNTLRHVMAVDQQFNQELLRRYQPDAKTIRLYRGVSPGYAEAQGAELVSGKMATVDTNSLSSWSTERARAEAFSRGGGHLLELDIAKDEIFMMGTGMPDTIMSIQEKEFILKGGKRIVKVL